MPIILHCLRILKLLQEAVHSYPVRENTFRNSQYSANSPFVIWNSNCISLFCRSISPFFPMSCPWFSITPPLYHVTKKNPSIFCRSFPFIYVSCLINVLRSRIPQKPNKAV